ncbi:ABC transporter ATP-binding protein [uncultured Microbacterium sp.]|uniref:ABC transporter ATP-binding protein n=1 Tax=uncultured Microbacterium sp. TaxID=191216 RepID=UPI0028DD31F3|nr:ABC transporter ATP-binding protein [uncultured Microbacterium sp.]
MTLEDVGHRFSSERPLFSGLTTTLVEGRSCAIVGPSGAGKSTLLGLIAGDAHPTEGRIERPADLTIAWVFQNPFGVPRRTALDHATLPLLAAGWSRRDADEEARALLRDFGLAGVEKEQFRRLSGGEAQRLMLARAVASGPDLLLVDEPTAQLDRRTAETVNGVLAQLRDRGCIVVIATHDPATRDSCSTVLDLGDFMPSPSEKVAETDREATR